MLFGKPVLCFEYAGGNEMIAEGKNGFVFDPYHPEQLANYMLYYIQNPGQIQNMGQHSKKIIEPHTPANAAAHLVKVISFTFGSSRQK